MRVEVKVDALWPTRVRITLDGCDTWLSNQDAKTLRDQLISILRPTSKEDLLEVARYINGVFEKEIVK